MSLLSELNRRNVFRVGAAYVVTSWLLIQVAETIFPLFGFDDAPARVVVVVLAIGLVPALVIAWAFELTPEGIRRETAVDRSQSVTVQTGKKLDRVIALVLALALAYFAFDKFVLDPARDAALVEETVQQARSDALVESYGELSIAVLPFENLSDDPQQEYFSDGMAEELLNLLTRVQRLRVISRSSSFAFKGQPINIPTIAAKLGVNHIVEGSVRKSGDRIRITAQLIEARSDTHLWSQTYERRLEDVFAIQDEISAAIVDELQAALALPVAAGAAANAPASTEAYEAYLRGKFLMAQRTSDTLEAAIEQLEMAIELDPDYALAHAELAIAIRLLTNYGDLTGPEAQERARPHAERALELAPELPEAHAAMAWVNWGESESLAQEHFRRAIDLNPSYAEAHLWLGNSFLQQRRYRESTEQIRKAAQLDPLSLPARSTYFGHLVRRGQLDEAREELDKLASLNPGGFFYHDALIRMGSLGGHWADGALASLDAWQSGNWQYFTQLLMFCAFMGLEPEATADISDLGIDPEGLGILAQATPTRILLWLGRPREAVEAFERTFGEDPQVLDLIYGQSLAGAGDYERAEPVLEGVWEPSTDAIGIPWFDARLILSLMASRREMGGEFGTADIEDALSDAVERYIEAGLTLCNGDEGCVHFDRGILAYLGGDRGEGLASIALAIEEGFFIPLNHAYLQFLYDDPGFAPILETQRHRQAREREKFLSVVCNDNPYADVWQPSDETCQTYNALRE
jgi:adenylate cyclase